jgi:CRISPR-associated protein Csb2
MLAIEFELLTGRYAATSHNDRSRAEWPPHPARVFSALVAAHYEGRDPCPKERAALEWLERQPAPSMAVPLDGIAERDVKSVYVPINDVSAIGDLDAGRRDVEAQLNDAHRNGASQKEIKDLHRKLEKAQASLDKAIAALGDDGAKRTDSERKSAGALLPEHRSRKARTFPVIVPPTNVFTLVWPQS